MPTWKFGFVTITAPTEILLVFAFTVVGFGFGYAAGLIDGWLYHRGYSFILTRLWRRLRRVTRD